MYYLDLCVCAEIYVHIYIYSHIYTCIMWFWGNTETTSKKNIFSYYVPVAKGWFLWGREADVKGQGMGAQGQDIVLGKKSRKDGIPRAEQSH